MQVVVNLESIVGIAVLAGVAIIVPLGLGLLWLLDRIACAVRRRQQKRIDEAYREEAEE